ncbi:MAG: dTMP kinase [Candidatus Aenigmatarchaeota archaeon]
MGKYIVIEGIDGAGKTTICNLLSKDLENSFLIKEPSDREIGKFIRFLLESQNENMRNPFISMLMFFSDRISIREKIIELRNSYNYIISDRSFLSTYAYQISLIEDEKEKKIFLNIFRELLKLIEIPDVIVILDVDIDVALERIRKDNRTKTLYENGEFLKKVSENYRNLKLDLDNVYLVDANRDINDVERDVLSIIKQL